MSTDARPAAGAILEIDGLQLGPIGTNCYLVRELGAERALVVDPGADAERVVALAAERGVVIGDIVVTHCHWDHIGGVAALATATGAEVWMSAAEAPALETPEQFPSPVEITAWRVDHRLDGGERIEVAGIALDVLSTPGHSPGHLTFVADGIRDASGDAYEQPPIAFVGDVVFRGSVGRTDLPFSDGETLARSLELLTRKLHPETILLSGHGGATTMRAELATNPFLQGI